jgi:hypothetical protein
MDDNTIPREDFDRVWLALENLAITLHAILASPSTRLHPDHDKAARQSVDMALKCLGETAPEQEYDVDICRVNRVRSTMRVKAQNHHDAEMKALDRAGDIDFNQSTSDVEYVCEAVTRLRDTLSEGGG